MELLRYLGILRKRWLLIALTVVAAALAAYGTTDRSDRYSASSQIFVGSSQFTPESLRGDAFIALDRILLTYSAMIDSEPIASDALELLGEAGSPTELVSQTVASPRLGTQLLIIRVTADDPVEAANRANAMATAFVTAIQEFEPGVTEPSTVVEGELPTGLPAYVFETAKLPTSPADTGLFQRLVLAIIFGFLAAAAVALGIDYLDLTLRDPADAERRLELPVLGTIPLGRDDFLSAEMRAIQARRTRELDHA